MSKLHEILAVEATVAQAAEKLLRETAEKFGRHSEFFTGFQRTLERVGSTPEDMHIQDAAKTIKALPTNVPATLSYVFPFVDRALTVKLQKHLANQVAKADVVLDGNVILKDAPVDFLLDLEKSIPNWRAVFAGMPTLDPSKEWDQETKGVWKTKEPNVTAQTEKKMFAVVLHGPTDKHPAQVKESSRDEVVGKFIQVNFSGAATSQQKADALALCDKLLVAVKQARMRANTAEVPKDRVQLVSELFTGIFK